jgi:3-phosphoshikimate 1-carboxyvinyltransferase
MVLASVRQSSLEGMLRPPSSLPLASRLLWMACMGEGGVIGRLPEHPDITAILQAGQALGADGVIENNVADIFGPSDPTPPDSLSCFSNPTLTRLLMPLSLLTGQPAALAKPFLSPALARWVDEAALALGVRVMQTKGLLEMRGAPSGDALPLAERAGAFFAPGVLMAAPVSDIPLMVTMDEFVLQQPSVQLTLRVLDRLGVGFSWEESEPTFTAVPGQTYPELNVEVEADWRTGSYMLGAFLLAGRGAVSLPRDSVQSERSFWLGLEQAGRLRWNDSGDALWAEAGDPLPLSSSLDLRSFSSLYPLALVLATQATGPVRLEPLFPLSPRSRRRLLFCAQQLVRIGADITISDSFVEVRPSALSGGEADSGGEGRIAMALALAGLISKQPVSIVGAEAASKSYPAFWSDLQSIGAAVQLDYSAGEPEAESLASAVKE